MLDASVPFPVTTVPTEPMNENKTKSPEPNDDAGKGPMWALSQNHLSCLCFEYDQLSYRVRNGAHPSHSSTLHFCDVVFAWYLPEMCAARHDMVQIACGCAAHSVFVLMVAPQMFRCRGGSLSRAHSVGRPPCSPRQCVATRELLFWMDVIFLKVALGSLPLVLPLRDTSFCGLTQERLGG